MHMHDAIDEHEHLQNDIEAKDLLKKYFTYTAHYIVAAMEYMRPDQVRMYKQRIHPYSTFIFVISSNS